MAPLLFFAFEKRFSFSEPVDREMARKISFVEELRLLMGEIRKLFLGWPIPSLSRFAKMRPFFFSSQAGGDVNLDGQLQQIIDELLAHGITLDLAKKEFEKKYIAGAVKRSSGNMGRAAHSLGIHRNTLRNRVGILNIRLPREKHRVSPDITKKK